MKRLVVALLLSLTTLAMAFSAPADGVVTGKVSSLSDGQPIAYAVVIVHPLEVYATTSDDGSYRISNLPAGEVTISVEFIGYANTSRKVTISSGKTLKLDFALEEETFRLDEVTVTATASDAGKSTASMISRQAMDHLQTSSVKDVLTLLPGVSFENPSLNSSQTIALRTDLSSNNGGLAMNSLGTSIIVDGAPVSNNANMQALSSAVSGGNMDVSLVGGTSPETGVDMRSLSTDNIESVEVIRGIPSAEYGDLTSGAVIVKSKAGKMPLSIRFKTNPNIYQVSANKGFHTNKAGDINFGADYAYSTSSLTSSYINYQRINAKALLTKTLWGKLNTNTSLLLGIGRDRRNRNPDDELNATSSFANNVEVRLASYGQFNIGGNFLKSINYSISGSYTDKHNFYETQAQNANGIYSTAMGFSTLTNVSGMTLVDVDGNAITSFDKGDETATATVTPNVYISHYDIYGKEINAYAKLVANFFHKVGKNIDSRTIAGIDFKTDGNLGQGLVLPSDLPPLRNGTNSQSGYRPRAYYDIPFINQLGVFAEETWNQVFCNRHLDITAGLRFDYVNGLTSLAPRINASIEIVPSVLTLRGGWGISSKAPTSAYLYPQKAYSDLINYSNRFSGTANELVVGTTKVYDTSNPKLEMARNRKAEVGLDITIAKRYKIQLTAYDEYMKNGYSFGSDLSTFIMTQHVLYKNVNSDPTAMPILAVDKTYNNFFHFNKPLNDLCLHNRGLEYEINLGRFEAIRTAFHINGAWMLTESSSSANTFTTRKNGGNAEYNVAIYDPYLHTSCVEKVLTTFRATHNIPAIGFVITLAGQVNWFGKTWTRYGNDEMFSRYISYKDGQVHDFDPALKDDPEFRYMFEPKSEQRFLPETTPPYVLLNINISKEIGHFLTASFFVNNVLNTRPLNESDIIKGTYYELGIPMFFGLDINIKFKQL